MIEILSKDQLVETIYRDGISAETCYEKLNGCIDAFAYKNPDMRILEIGARAASATLLGIETSKLHGE